MSNKKQVSSKIRAKPPVDTNKPKYEKRIGSLTYTFGEYDSYITEDGDGNINVCEFGFHADDIPVVIEILQDIYKNRGLL